jgi:iron complex transport system substrate-binding protein
MKCFVIPAVRRIAVILLLMTPFALYAQADPVHAIDARGTTLRLPHPAQRIVTLAPNLTELVFAAGAGDRLAGVARFSDYPPAARRLPVVSDAVQVDLERLLVLRADLVLAWQGGTPPDVIARLERAGLPVFVAGASGLDDIARNITAIAQVAGTTAAAAPARAAFDADLRALRARRHEGAPVRVFYEIWDRPLMTVNKTHLISEIITLCGGINVFAGLGALTPEVSREALLAARPDIVLGGSSADTPAAFAARWAALPPPFNGWTARHLPADLIQRPTPRIVEGARRLCAHLDAVRDVGR